MPLALGQDFEHSQSLGAYAKALFLQPSHHLFEAGLWIGPI